MNHTETHPFSNFIDALTVRETRMEDVLCDSLMLTRLGFGHASKRVKLTRDLTNASESLHLVKQWLNDKGFIISELTACRICVLQSKETTYVDCFIRLAKTAYEIRLDVNGDEAVVNEIEQWFNTMFKKTGALVSTITDIGSRGALERNTVHLCLEPGTCAEQVFYPFLKLPLDVYFDKFMASNESVLILYGPPGTGKSTFLRSLIATKTERSWLTYNKLVIESDLLINEFYNSEAHILALEDIDKYMGARADGNSLMASFLNASEGIVLRKDKKIIFSTNLSSIDKIDSALLRRGRCFDVIKFELLTVDQARAVELKMGLPAQDLSSKARWALSEILNPLTDDLQSSNRTAAGIGFK